MVRLRDLGFAIGIGSPGPRNAIDDVAGVTVGHATVVRDEPRVARTGVTIVSPRPRDEWQDLCYGGMHSFNGNGEMTGSHWLAESGLLSGPIGVTNTHQVGLVRDTLVAEELRRDPDATWCLPIVGETYDGFLNDIDAFHLTADDVHAALAAAERQEAVAEGNVGGGTGMICHQFKGGIGTSSRVVEAAGGTYTVGALVQANYGARELLRLDGRPIGRAIGPDVVPLPSDPTVADAGSIIVIVATDAPLLADQCQRVARRATVGLARVGGTGGNGSGDIFLAFSTANRVSATAATPSVVTTLPAGTLTPLFDATAEAVEESIWNALVAAETMTGQRGRIVNAVPHDLLTTLR
ncbi:MAG: P1 family peptidase [Acidimicrobiia bacterium]